MNTSMQVQCEWRAESDHVECLSISFGKKRKSKSKEFWQMFQDVVLAVVLCGSYSGVEFNLKGLLREEGLDEESGMSTVFTPIFFSDDSSVTEIERR